MSAHDHASGDKTRKRFDPARAARLDDPERFVYLPAHDVVALVDAPPNAVVLDFGAGTGAYAIAFARARPDCTVVALDVQPAMLDALRAKSDATLVRSGGAEILDALSGTIDRVFAINVLHELEDEHLRALFAALAPSATATFIDWNPAVERPAGPRAEHLYDAAEAERYLGTFGFSREQTRSFPYHYALRGSVQRTVRA
jgi:ubiquinone/menaquinone biosynthesis C-methylase UbiE